MWVKSLGEVLQHIAMNAEKTLVSCCYIALMLLMSSLLVQGPPVNSAAVLADKN